MWTGSGKDASIKSFVQNILDLLAALSQVIKQKDEELQPKYRLVDWLELNGVGYCKIHVIGTTCVNNYLPSVIVGDDAFISGFDKLDIRTITNLANAESIKPSATIISINYDKNNIEVKEHGRERTLLNIDGEIEHMIEKFNKQDIFNLGRLVGENDMKL
jgi:hypothetical protein